MKYFANPYQQEDPFVSSLRSSLGNLGEGLQGLATHKINEMAEKKDREQRAAFWKSAGLPDEVAHAFGSAPIEIQKALLDRLEGVEFGGSQQGVGQQQPQQQIGQQQRATLQQSQQPLQQEGFNPAMQEGQSLGGGIKLGASPAERRHRETIEGEKFKQSKEFRHEILQKAKAARMTLRDVDRLEELNSEGKLNNAGYEEFLTRSGLDIAALKSPESQEFQKIQQGFLRNAKEVFGGRVSNLELENYLKTVPSLSQSSEGRSRVIANLKLAARADLEHKNALKEVIAENKGIPPYDVEEQVDDKIDKKLDKLAEQFKKDLKKPVPKSQNKFITALQAGAGSVVGAPGKILSKVGGIAHNILV